MKIPFSVSVALITVNISLPPVTARSTTAPSLRDRVTQSLRDRVTKSRGVARRLKYRAQHCALTLKEKFHAVRQ